jgi:hypothetical protein
MYPVKKMSMSDRCDGATTSAARARHLLAPTDAYQEDRLERRVDERPDDPVQDPLAEIASLRGRHGSAPTAAS